MRAATFTIIASPRFSAHPRPTNQRKKQNGQHMSNKIPDTDIPVDIQGLGKVTVQIRPKWWNPPVSWLCKQFLKRKHSDVATREEMEAALPRLLMWLLKRSVSKRVET